MAGDRLLLCFYNILKNYSLLNVETQLKTSKKLSEALALKEQGILNKFFKKEGFLKDL